MALNFCVWPLCKRVLLTFGGLRSGQLGGYVLAQWAFWGVKKLDLTHSHFPVTKKPDPHPLWNLIATNAYLECLSLPLTLSDWVVLAWCNSVLYWILVCSLLWFGSFYARVTVADLGSCVNSYKWRSAGWFGSQRLRRYLLEWMLQKRNKLRLIWAKWWMNQINMHKLIARLKFTAHRASEICPPNAITRSLLFEFTS